MTLRYIRPLTSGELLDFPFGLMRALWGRLLAITLAGSVPLAAAQILLILPTLTLLPLNEPMLAIAGVIPLILTRWPMFALALALQPLHALPRAATTLLIGSRICGRDISARAAWRASWPAGLKLVVLSVPMTVLHALTLVTLIGLPGLGILIWLFGLLPLLVRWGFVTEVVTLERAPLRAAFGRSAQLARGLLGRTTAHALVAETLLLVVTLAPIGLLFFLDIRFSAGSSLYEAAALGVTGVMLLALRGWRPCWEVLSYFELRARREGLDIQMSLEGEQ